MFGNTEQDAGMETGHEGTREQSQLACPACGASTRRTGASYCATCGRKLDAEDYFPTDAVRASYHQQRLQPSMRAAGGFAREETKPARHANRRNHPAKPVRPDVLFAVNGNGASTTALAFVAYSLVPYIGIIFCPGALLMGGLGLMRAYRSPHVGGRSTSAMSIVLGVVVFGAQLLLWWILYKVPEWTQQPPGF